MIDLCTLLAEKRDGERPRETVWPSWKDYINLILKINGVNVWSESSYQRVGSSGRLLYRI